ncbi:hypothetical protein UA08_04851 [Talaromyces atroroseus]|uniref:Oxidase ustYa n=1 Tax=Talaromyces atroroseus TaxID=1441469 RepID=A0A225AHK2_TALAT|nr:hypothetical protein UA08_04851 [Talaromyces atroroseus]OKL60230.1 hypothetical protein UA08_04851 [Talaromyces atroroseus]
MSNLRYSESDEDRSFDGAEKDALLNDGPQPSDAISRRLLVIALISQSLLNLALILACVGLFIWGQSALKMQQQQQQEDYSILNAFGTSEEYMTLDHAFDHLWSETGNSSIVKTDDSDKVESISMFHQLHCLGSIRHALQQSKEGIDIGMDFHDNAHWPHCLDYLRQTILCFADDTMEQQTLLSNGTRSKVITGLKDVRKCRPREQLYALRAEHGIFIPGN